MAKEIKREKSKTIFWGIYPYKVSTNDITGKIAKNMKLSCPKDINLWYSRSNPYSAKRTRIRHHTNTKKNFSFFFKNEKDMEKFVERHSNCINTIYEPYNKKQMISTLNKTRDFDYTIVFNDQLYFEQYVYNIVLKPRYGEHSNLYNYLSQNFPVKNETHYYKMNRNVHSFYTNDISDIIFIKMCEFGKYIEKINKIELLKEE